jgi:hypothetical protein
MSEPKAVAECVNQALGVAKWKFVPWEHGSLLLGGIAGVLVHFDSRADSRTREAAGALASELSKEGIAAQLQQDGNPGNQIVVDVGTKP